MLTKVISSLKKRVEWQGCYRLKRKPIDSDLQLDRMIIKFGTCSTNWTRSRKIAAKSRELRRRLAFVTAQVAEFRTRGEFD